MAQTNPRPASASGTFTIGGDLTVYRLGFIPWFPLATGDLARGGGKLNQVAQRHHATPGQIALAWLLLRSPNMLPIPGTSSVKHLEANLAAAEIRLSDAEFQALDEGV